METELTCINQPPNLFRAGMEAAKALLLMILFFPQPCVPLLFLFAESLAAAWEMERDLSVEQKKGEVEMKLL